MPDIQLFRGDCLKVLPRLAPCSIDAVVSDPPYPCVHREYGYWTEAEWFKLMRSLLPAVMRLLKPTGSAIFILQPNSERVGRMRTWLWEFMTWVGKEWGMVQDVWWWNPTTPPTVHVHRTRGGLRPSVKACVWIGPHNCYRNQEAVLWTPSDAAMAENREDRALNRRPGGQTIRRDRYAKAADERGGVTPFNLLPISNADSQSSSGAHGHPAGTPKKLVKWWIRYLCPPAGIVLDPFMGSGTTGVTCLETGHRFIGIELNPGYFAISKKRIHAARRKACATP